MIVFDSSTLILLAKTELIDAVISGYKGVILMTGTVMAEITAKESLDGLLIKKLVETGKIKVKITTGNEIIKLMKDFNIDKGEAETIAAPLKNPGSLVATDDRNAIKACKLIGLPFATSMGFLIKLQKERLLSKERALTMLEKLSNFGRYRSEIVENARSKITGGL